MAKSSILTKEDETAMRRFVQLYLRQHGSVEDHRLVEAVRTRFPHIDDSTVRFRILNCLVDARVVERKAIVFYRLKTRDS